MNPKYVPSLSICKELVKAGWVKDTLFTWQNGFRTDGEFELVDIGYYYAKYAPGKVYPAPISDEILEELPKNIRIKNTRNNFWILTYESPSQIKNGVVTFDREVIEDNDFCNALAKMWLYLKSNKLI